MFYTVLESPFMNVGLLVALKDVKYEWDLEIVACPLQCERGR